MYPLYLVCWVLSLSSCRVTSLSVDGVALITFKKNLVSDPYSVLGNWNASNDTPCSWNGIVCANVPGNTVLRVVGLTVIGKGLTGALAPALGALDALRRLSLQENNLTGTVPAQLFNATSLQTILLGKNRITGSLPPQIGRLVGLQTLDMSSNSLSGTIPHTITRCVSLQTLVLANNLITGAIPAGFGVRFISLEQLDLSANRLSGTIPDDFGKFSSLQGTLNLSYNHLSGMIPASLGKLPYFVSLDLSHNGLSGKIPQDGSLADQGSGPFLGNPKLCGIPLNAVCHVSPPLPSLPAERPPSSSKQEAKEGSRKPNLSTGAIIAIAVGDAFGISIVAMLIMYWYYKNHMHQEGVSTPNAFAAMKSRRYRSRRCFIASSEVSSDASGSPEKSREQGELVSLDKRFSSDLDELLRASAYVLGKSGQGIVYKVVLGSGTPVAVRRLGDGGNQKQKEFENEVQAISKVRHPNVVKLLAYYWAVEEKLLIYEYISYGTLASALHGKNTKSPTKALTWIERLKILQATAEGLAHIHDCRPYKHVHGDIKTSKILLGPDMQAHVADFGVSKLVSIASEMDDVASCDWPSTPRVKNSSKFYRAPESLTRDGKPSQKWDVYSFGVVMLEVLSGRSPATLMASTGMDLVAWIHTSIEGAQPHEPFLDSSIALATDTLPPGLSTLLNLAIACTSSSPDSRPKMKSIAKEIHKLVTKVN